MRGVVQQVLGLTAVSGLLFFVSLGGVELWDEDEPIFAGAAREMMDRHDWVVPYFNARVLPDKPVLNYWVMIAGYRLFGPTEFAARAGSALFSIGSVLLTWTLGRQMFSSRAGLWAGLALATSLGFDIIARAATPDAVLTFFCTLVVVCYVRKVGPASLRAPAHRAGSERAGDHSGRWPHPTFFAIAGMYAATGMALLAKGPIGLLPAIAIGLFSLLSTPLEVATADDDSTGWLTVARRALQSLVRRLRPRHVWQSIRPLHPLMGLVIVCAVAGPWYVAVGLRTDGAWLAGFFGRHNVERFLHPLENHRGPIYYYLVAAVVGFFPWSLFLGPIAILLKSRLADRNAGRARYGLLFCWIGTYLVFFSLAATKLPNYIAPIYPPLALLAGAWLDAWLAGECQVPALLLRTAWTILGLVGVCVSIALPLVAQRLLGEGTSLAVVGLPLVVGSGLCFWFSTRSQRGRVVTAFAASAVASMLLLFGFGAVEVGRRQTSRTFADAVRRQNPTGPVTVGTYGYWRPSLVFYLGPQVDLMHNEEQARDFCQQWPADRFLITTADRYARLAPSLPSEVSVLVRQRWFLRPDELLLLGRDKSADTRMGALRWPTSPNH